MRRIGRREFLIGAAGLAGLGAISQMSNLTRAAASLKDAGPEARAARRRVKDGPDTEADPAKKHGLVIDVGACIGCRRCMWGCKEENNTPDSISPLWIETFQFDSEVDLTGHPSMEELKAGATTSYTTSPTEGHWYMPVACFHCDNAPCVKVCPTGATYKDKDGLVLMDYDKCVGCRLCVVACPYSARRFNWYKPQGYPEKMNELVPLRPMGVVEKCTMCVHRIRRGLKPRCVEVCPVQARHFGDLNDPESEVSTILEENMSFRLLEEVNTQPSVRYIMRGKKWLP
jgi:molybdopterin-containing oxidoreductase family iron-sulfur binding subunit